MRAMSHARGYVEYVHGHTMSIMLTQITDTHPSTFDNMAARGTDAEILVKAKAIVAFLDTDGNGFMDPRCPKR